MKSDIQIEIRIFNEINDRWYDLKLYNNSDLITLTDEEGLITRLESSDLYKILNDWFIRN